MSKRAAKPKLKPKRKLVALNLEALRFALASVRDDRFKCSDHGFDGQFDRAEAHLIELIRLAEKS